MRLANTTSAAEKQKNESRGQVQQRSRTAGIEQNLLNKVHAKKQTKRHKHTIQHNSNCFQYLTPLTETKQQTQVHLCTMARVLQLLLTCVQKHTCTKTKNTPQKAKKQPKDTE